MRDTIERRSTGSTNDDAKALAAHGARHLTVVWAHTQTAGRGRLDRRWVSVEGNLFWSIILRPEGGWPRISDIVYVNGLAVHHALRAIIGPAADLRLKWPNDVLLNDGKISGSLIESGGRWTESRPEWVVIGTGINIAGHPGTSDLRYLATSLHEEGFRHVTRAPFVELLRSSLETQIGRWVRQGFEPVRAEYLSVAHNLDRDIRVRWGPEQADEKEGVYRGIDDEGSLLLEGRDGRTERLRSGDVIVSNRSTR
jgi:BirA family biotin operon repressor/biotin-[acetyl-CoA-carboxylase] ligase